MVFYQVTLLHFLHFIILQHQIIEANPSAAAKFEKVKETVQVTKFQQMEYENESDRNSMKNVHDGFCL